MASYHLPPPYIPRHLSKLLESSAIKENREFWTWLVTAGLILLMIEWYVYNRRVYF